MSPLRYLKDAATLSLDTGRCTGCGLCGEVCPHGVFAIKDRKARIADLDACMECGACARNCPTLAISVVAGVGCAQAIIRGALNKAPPSCDGSDSKGGCC